MKSLTLHLDERAYGALLMVAPDATAPGLAAFAREALGKHVDCMMEGTKEDEVAALFQREPHREEATPEGRTVSVELSGFGAGLLQMVMAHDGHATAADAFRAMLAGAGGDLCGEIAHETDAAKLAGRLAPADDEDDALATAANRSDLPLVAAAKPPKRQP